MPACEALRDRLAERGGEVPAGGLEAAHDTAADIKAQARLARHAFGAQFAEVRVDVDSGEVRVPRLYGVFAAGRIINSKTARSQFIGGMTMGMSMALLEESVMDVEFGDHRRPPEPRPGAIPHPHLRRRRRHRRALDR